MRFTFEPSEMIGPGRVEVNVHDSVDAMRAWAAANNEAIAPESMAFTTDFGSDAELAAQIHFAADALHLSLIAHECTHAAFAVYNRFRSQMVDLPTHSEDLPEWIGNLTALIYFSLRGDGFTLDPDD